MKVPTLSIRYWFQSITESCNWFPSNFNRNYLNYWFANSIFKALFLRSKINNKFNNNINNNINISRKKTLKSQQPFLQLKQDIPVQRWNQTFFPKAFLLHASFPFLLFSQSFAFLTKALPLSDRNALPFSQRLFHFHQVHTLFSKVSRPYLIF